MDQVHREPHPRSVDRSVMPTVSHVHWNPSLFESICTTWPCLSSPRDGPSPAQTGPSPAHQGPVVARSTFTIDRSMLTVDLDPHISDSHPLSQSELNTCHCLDFLVLFPFSEIHLIFRNS
jgi:hypothetical protein